MTSLRMLMCSLLLLSLAVGCEKKEPEIKGTLTQNGQPLTVSDKGDIQIQFVQESGGGLTGKVFMGTLDKSTGQYVAQIPPGDYRVVVQQLDPYPNVDKLKGKFTQAKTPIKKTVVGGETVDIELSEYDK